MRVGDENSVQEQITSRPSSASSDQEDEHVDFARRLSSLNEEELKSSINNQAIVWDDPFESLSINENTGRIGLSGHTHPSSSTSRCRIRQHEMDVELHNSIISFQHQKVLFSVRKLNRRNDQVNPSVVCETAFLSQFLRFQNKIQVFIAWDLSATCLRAVALFPSLFLSEARHGEPLSDSHRLFN